MVPCLGTMNAKHLSVERNEQSPTVKLKTKKHKTFILPNNFILASFGTLYKNP